MTNKIHIIDPKPYEKAITIGLFLFILIVTCLCAYWISVLWKSRNHNIRLYKEAINIRLPKYVIISYAIILPWIVQESIATIYLYCDGKDRSSPEGTEKWTYYNGIPIYYSVIIDEILHYLFWIAFWSFIQMKLLKVWHLWTLYETDQQIIRFSLNFSLHYREETLHKQCRSITNNRFLFDIFIPILIVALEAVIRELEYSQAKEQIVIIITFICQFIIYGWPLIQIPSNDNYFIAKECKYLYLLSLIVFIDWIIFDIIGYNNFEYIWVKTGTLLLYAIWILISCYCETIWVLNKLKTLHESHDNKHKMNQYQHLSFHESHTELAESTNLNMCVHKESKFDYELKDILSTYDGFMEFMEFCQKEFACKNLLCFVEISEYIQLWKNKNELIIAPVDVNKYYVKLVNGYVRMNEYRLCDNVAILILEYYKHLYIDCGLRITEDFKFLDMTHFSDDITNRKYLIKKYFCQDALLWVHVGEKMRNELCDCEMEEFVEKLNLVRAQLWVYLEDIFSRFDDIDVEYFGAGKYENSCTSKSDDN